MANIIEIGLALVVGEEPNGIDNLGAHTHLKEVIESVRGILNYVVEESGTLFFRCFPGESNGEGMEYYGVAVYIVPTAMSLQGYSEAEVNHLVCGFGYFLFRFHILQYFGFKYMTKI